ncbi:amidase [Cohaesibacter sp. CAU 1516]|uniref:amidase n=1 Tax=Cohaesibacter sp. CAU 1516 TaxID=2576038 RepID=UPI0010FEB106|nr:amidase [Cohaesibacter sp. CAU 1516]TLP48424.1 amidase [Cohaesibacter sp. CAU 1516]
MVETKSNSGLVGPVSLLDQLKAMEQGSLSPEASIAACLERIDQVEEHLKAFCALNANATSQIASSGPLKGIGLAVKDIFDTADLPTAHGSPIYHAHNPARDASIVMQARRAGCTLLGKTVTTEFAFFHPGPTRNPHNLDHTPGGSSSGSAAAVASGMAHLAIGSQTGGSIIRPAAFCGITGYKPSAGLLPKPGMKDGAWSLDTIGLYTATVADVAYAMSALTGRNCSIQPRAPFRTPKFGVVRSHSWPEADPGYKSRFNSLLEHLHSLGAELVEIEPSETWIAAFHAHQIIQDYEIRQSLAWEHDTHGDLLSPVLKQTLDFAKTITAADYDEAHLCAQEARIEAAEHLEDLDAFLSLSAPGPAPLGLASTGSSIFNRIWTLFGLPCVNVAGMQTEDGLPLGVQIIGPFMEDHHTLHIAHWLEGAIARARS